MSQIPTFPWVMETNVEHFGLLLTDDIDTCVKEISLPKYTVVCQFLLATHAISSLLRQGNQEGNSRPIPAATKILHLSHLALELATVAMLVYYFKGIRSFMNTNVHRY